MRDVDSDLVPVSVEQVQFFFSTKLNRSGLPRFVDEESSFLECLLRRTSPYPFRQGVKERMFFHSLGSF